MADERELLSALDAIDPSSLGYEDWCRVGMALKAEGAPVGAWDTWSARDPGRYNEGECERKWRSFGSRDEGVTARTVFRLAYDAGWSPGGAPGSAYGWGDAIEATDAPPAATAPRPRPVTATTVDARDVGEEPVPDGPPADADAEVAAYLRALFGPDEHVGFVTDQVARGKDGRWRPSGAGYSDRTRDELLDSMEEYPGQLDCTFCTASPEAGAWVRVNPLDGEGASDANVSAYRHALVESDTLPPGKQLALIREMRLPVAAISTSGGKSVHAVVRVDAADKREYRERVTALYEFCRASGFDCDEQNRNPSRLTRLPGFRRGSGWQRLVQAGPGEGPASWDEWQDWVAEQASGLPDIVSAGEVGDLPELAPQLIAGVIRDGQKGMLIGPSKAGKSFALIELAVAVCRGWGWMGHRCARGRVLYVNMEIQGPSFLHRLADVYSAMGREEGEPPAARPLDGLDGLDIWSLRGHSAPLDKLVPMLVRRAADRRYRLVIIDPIYKVLTGDENSASDMAAFTNQFDVIASELGCAVFYAHHHAKGEAGRRASVDRASGSGVFARDPDAILDMSPLAVPASLRGVLEYEVMGDDGRPHERHGAAYRVSYTLREFETPPPRDVVFRWPLHARTDELASCRVVGEAGPSGGPRPDRSAERAGRWGRVNEMVGAAVAAIEADGRRPTVGDVAAWIGSRMGEEARSLGVDREALSRWSKPSERSRRAPMFGFEKRADGPGAYVLAPVEGHMRTDE
ncbi:MAG: AAA family ATPase [Collinsella sp.]|nr:AAA family ATPase [Collinsella sp.]